MAQINEEFAVELIKFAVLSMIAVFVWRKAGDIAETALDSLSDTTQ